MNAASLQASPSFQIASRDSSRRTDAYRLERERDYRHANASDVLAKRAVRLRTVKSIGELDAIELDRRAEFEDDNARSCCAVSCTCHAETASRALPACIGGSA